MFRLTEDFIAAIEKAGNYKRLPHNEVRVVTMSWELTFCSNRVVAGLSFLDSNCIDKAVTCSPRNVRRAVASIGKMIGFNTGKNQVKAVA